MTGLAELAGCLGSAWLLWRLVDRCYRGPLPRDVSGLDESSAAAREPGLRTAPGGPAARRDPSG